MAAKGTITPPRPLYRQIAREQTVRRRLAVLHPRAASGMSATMIRALYMMAASIAEAVPGQMHDVEHLQTRIKGHEQRRDDREVLWSFGDRKRGEAAAGHGSCLPIRTISMSLVGESPDPPCCRTPLAA